jgi:hypothetical protein
MLRGDNLLHESTYQISEISDAAHDAAGRIELSTAEGSLSRRSTVR